MVVSKVNLQQPRITGARASKEELSRSHGPGACLQGTLLIISCYRETDLIVGGIIHSLSKALNYMRAEEAGWMLSQPRGSVELSLLFALDCLQSCD